MRHTAAAVGVLVLMVAVVVREEVCLRAAAAVHRGVGWHRAARHWATAAKEIAWNQACIVTLVCGPIYNRSHVPLAYLDHMSL